MCSSNTVDEKSYQVHQQKHEAQGGMEYSTVH